MIINMKTQKLKNRWLIAASAVGIHISIGSVYAYSVMTNPVKDIFDVDGSVIKWAFKIAILLLGLSAAFLGRWVEKVGPKVSGTTAGIFYGIGILGSGIYMVLILSSARYIERPPEGYLPEGYNPGEGKTIKKDIANISADAALKTPRFYYIWIMMFINIACGIAIISAASPMMQEKLNYTPMEAAAIVGFIGVFNGLGRIIWSTLSDYLGRANTYIMFFAFQILAFYFLPKMTMELVIFNPKSSVHKSF